MNDKIKLTNVRLSFPSLFRRAVFEGQEGKFEATFLIDADSKQAEMLKKKVAAEIKASGKKIPSDKICVRNGDDVGYDGYAGMLSIKASSNKRPTVVNTDKTPLAEDDGVLYAGCYVNAIIDFWIQDNAWGKRLNANLHGVQFAKDGVPFGSGPIDVTDEFDVVDGIEADEEIPW